MRAFHLWVDETESEEIRSELFWRFAANHPNDDVAPTNDLMHFQFNCGARNYRDYGFNSIMVNRASSVDGESGCAKMVFTGDSHKYEKYLPPGVTEIYFQIDNDPNLGHIKKVLDEQRKCSEFEARKIFFGAQLRWRALDGYTRQFWAPALDLIKDRNIQMVSLSCSDVVVEMPKQLDGKDETEVDLKVHDSSYGYVTFDGADQLIKAIRFEADFYARQQINLENDPNLQWSEKDSDEAKQLVFSGLKKIKNMRVLQLDSRELCERIFLELADPELQKPIIFEKRAVLNCFVDAFDIKTILFGRFSKLEANKPKFILFQIKSDGKTALDVPTNHPGYIVNKDAEVCHAALGRHYREDPTKKEVCFYRPW